MKLSEAISLGHTLISEDRLCFYDPSANCGCAIGSAAAALGEARKLPIKFRHIEGETDPFEWLASVWAWTGLPATNFPQLYGAWDSAVVGAFRCLSMSRRIGLTAGHAISDLHEVGMPRLEIAKLIAQIEPDEPVVHEEKVGVEVSA